MSTDLVKMGEQKGRKTPDVVVSVRDNSAEVLQHLIIENLRKVTTNEVDDKEAIEGICGEVLEYAHLLLRSWEVIGASTRADVELENLIRGKRIKYENIHA